MRDLCHGLFLLILMVGGCSLKKPQAPSLDMTISIPVANEIRTMQRTVDEHSSFLTVGPDSVVSLDITQEIERRVVGNDLSIPAQESEFQTEVGAFEVGSQRSDTAEIPLVEVFPPAENLKGSHVPIPSIPLTQKIVDIPPFPIIRSVTVEEGQFTIQIDNGLVIPMDLDIILMDDSTHVEIGRFTFGLIETGSTVAEVLDLRGKTFSNNWSLDLRVSSPGSGGQSVDFDLTEPLKITTTITRLKVTEATAELPEHRFADSGSIPLPDTILVSEADVVSGSTFVVIVKNDLSVDAEINLSLDEMTFPSGDPVGLAKVFVGAQTPKVVLIPTDNARFRPRDPRNLRISWEVIIQPGGRRLATLRSRDVVTMDVVSQRITFSRVAGRFHELPMDIPSTAMDLDIPDGLGGLSLAAASLELIIRSGLGITLKSDFIVTGTDDVGRTVIMPIQRQIGKGDPDAPVTSRIRLDRTNSRVVDLLNLLPRKLELGGRILIGDRSEESVVAQGHFVEGEARFAAPMVFSLDSTSIRTDPREITLTDEKARDKLERNLISANVIAKLSNHLPVGVNVRIQIATDPGRIFSDPLLTIPRGTFFSIPSGDVNPSTGRVEQATTTEQTIALGKTDLDSFLREPLYSGILIELPRTAGTVKLLASDFVAVTSRVEATILLDDTLVKR